MKRVAFFGLSALLLAGCGSNGDDMSAVCVDKDGNRVSDSQCSSGSSGMSDFMWFYLLSSMNQPALGTQVVHNNYYSHSKYAGFNKPKNATIYKGVPANGYKPKAGSSFKSKTYSKPVSPPKVDKRSFNKPANRYNPPKPPPAPRVRSK